ncbi:hypothetical protein QBC45DRAFT_445895 [Copromyces sp. CBS 386.78]|nr:hypothetical protein QBC45DRAFT_445895 [Copromyces sp. CBS 386.78]
MAPTSTPFPLGLTIPPRAACQHSNHGCGHIPSDKLPLIISVAVIVFFIVLAITCCSFRSRGLKKRNPAIKDIELAPSAAPPAMRQPARGAPGAETGAGAGAGAAVTSEGEPVQPTTRRVPTGGLNPLVPPPMYEETPPPPTYQRDARPGAPPVESGEMAPRYA